MIKKILFVFICIPMFLQAQKKLSGTFAPAEEYKWFILYKLKTTHQEYIDNGKIKEGVLTYTFKEDAKPGMYRLAYGLPQESKNFDFIYSGKEDIKFTFTENGSEFIASKENKLNTSYFSSINTVKKGINQYYQSGQTDEAAFLEIFKTLRETQDIFEKEAEGTIAYHFIKASRTYVPTTYERPEVMVGNIKKQYFSAVDFSNEYLQNSDFITDKVSNYVFTALPLKEFTGEELKVEYQKNIDTVVEKLKDIDPAYKKTILNVLWEQMSVLENQDTANYISDTYLIPLAKELNDKVMVEKLEIYKRLSYGEIAPDFSWTDDGKAKKLSEIEGAENYILVFWSSTCSHCLEELPRLKKFVEGQEKDKFKVIAVGLEDDRYSWANEISFYPDFVHVLGLGRWENEIGNMYDITATPTFFVLNKDKRIIGKPYDVKEMEEHYNKM